MEEHIVFLKDTLGNSEGERARITKLTMDAVYYYDGLKRWCCFDLTEEGEWFAFATGESLTSDILEGAVR
jgi:hypothetical protein